MSRDRLADIEAAVARRTISVLDADETPVVEALLVPERRRLFRRDSKALGYGVEQVVDLVAPYVVIMSTWAVCVVFEELKDIARKRIRALTRRALGVDEECPVLEPGAPIPDEAQLAQLICNYAHLLGLDHPRARTLGDVVAREAYRQRG